MAKTKFVLIGRKDEAIPELDIRLSKTIRQHGSKKNMRKMGELAARLIKSRTRKGFGLGKSEYAKFVTSTAGRSGGTITDFEKVVIRKTRLPALSPDYQEWREDNEDLLHETASVSKATNTLTGQLLESIGVKDFGRGRVVIGPTKERRKNPSGRGKSKTTNSELIGHLAAMDRAFFAPSATEMRVLIRFLRQGIRKNIRRNKLRRRDKL